MVAAQRVAQGWEALAEACYVVCAGTEVFLEPYVIDARTGKCSAVLRIFVSQAEAEDYLSAMSHCDYTNLPLTVRKTALADVYGQREYLYDLADREYGLRLRMELTSMDDGNWPESVDVLWHPSRRMH